MDANSPEIKSVAEFAKTPAGLQKRWTLEIGAAQENQKPWWADGDKVIKEFLGEGGKERLNLFHSDVVTKGAQLYGNIPTVHARRRFADADDDVARVSADILERMLSTDIERDSDGFQTALDNALGDWLKPGLGQIRFRYEPKFSTLPAVPAKLDEEGTELAPEVPEQEVKEDEDVECDYVFWRDYLWSPCRTWDEVRWTAYRAEMTRDACVARFGEEIGKRIPLRAKDRARDGDDKLDLKDTWARAEVWEIWSKEDQTVYWYAEGMDVILDQEPDPLGLPNFFPSPKPLLANTTTSKLMPKPGYLLAESLYEQAHELTRRINLLVDAVKVAGAYDRNFADLAQIVSSKCQNILVPVENWAGFAEKGGVAGSISFVPIEQVVKAIAELVIQRNLVKQAIYEVTGQSDIMRGQAAEKATATEQRIKARFGGTRIVADQRELARFASEAQRIRAFIITKHFDPQTIIERSNIANAGDPELIQQAVDLLKRDVSVYRIEVDADSLGMTDWDAEKADSLEFLTTVGTYLKEIVEVAAPMPWALPHLLEMMKQGVSRLRAAKNMESALDRLIKAAEQAAQKAMEAASQPPPTDPKLEATKIKAQAEAGKAQASMVQTQMDAQAKTAEHGMKMQQMAQQHQMDQANFGMRMAEMQAKREAAADVPGVPMPEEQ